MTSGLLERPLLFPGPLDRQEAVVQLLKTLNELLSNQLL